MNGPAVWIVSAMTLMGVGVLIIGTIGEEKAPARVGKTTDQRVREGPYIASTTPLSASEELSIVVVPSRLHEVFDTQCLIYRNRELQQVVFICPDVRQDDLEKPER